MNTHIRQEMVVKVGSSSVADLTIANAPGKWCWGRARIAAAHHKRGISTGVLASLLLSTTMVAHASQPQKFLTFDRGMTPAQVIAHPDEYVFVWGASNPALTAAFNKASPKTSLSAYYPYSRDPNARHGIDYWNALHPDWLAYACDGTTPVTMYGDRNVALDITRPGVIEWQIANFLKRPVGMDAVALDNFQFANDGRVCGVLDSSGRFAKLYAGTSNDPAFSRDAVDWLEKVSAALHVHQVKVVVNHIPDLSTDGDDPDLPMVQSMVQAVDGILDEHAHLAMRDARKAALLAKLVAYAGAKGRWMYLLYQINGTDRNAVESAVANYLMMAGPYTAIYISNRDKTYGHEPDFMGFDKDVGNPCGPARIENGAMLRSYTHGLAIFAPAGLALVAVPIIGSFQNADGSDAGSAVRLEGGSGRILYTSRSNACGSGG